jgi:hypothetical protein
MTAHATGQRIDEGIVEGLQHSHPCSLSSLPQLPSSSAPPPLSAHPLSAPPHPPERVAW